MPYWQWSESHLRSRIQITIHN